MLTDRSRKTQPLSELLSSATPNFSRPSDAVMITPVGSTPTEAKTTTAALSTLTGKELSKAEADLQARYGKADIVRTYTPDNCHRWARDNRDRCLIGTAPTLKMLSDVYGADFAVSWLASQFAHLNTILNLAPERQLTPEQCEFMAAAWVETHATLKISELWVFFLDYFGGRYGKKVFGGIDPTEMGDDIRHHITARRQVEYKYQQEERKRQIRNDQDALQARIEHARTMMGDMEQWGALTDEQKQPILLLAEYYGFKTANFCPNAIKDMEDYHQKAKGEKTPPTEAQIREFGFRPTDGIQEKRLRKERDEYCRMMTIAKAIAKDFTRFASLTAEEQEDILFKCIHGTSEDERKYFAPEFLACMQRYEGQNYWDNSSLSEFMTADMAVTITRQNN